MFDFWLVPNWPTIGSRVTLSMCSIWRNSVLSFDDFALLRRMYSAQMTNVGHQEGGI